MNTKKRIYLSLLWILLGAALFLCSAFGSLDSYWSGMGGGLLGVGIMQLIRFSRYESNEEYRTKADRANKDERNKFIANKAWAWAGYLFVLISAVGSILLKLAGREDLMMMASGSVCLIILLYWASYLYLQKKY